MARSSVASREARRKPASGHGRTAVPPRRRLPGVKVWLFGAVLLSLLGLIAFALSREVASVATDRQSAAARPAIATPRPALTAAEEAYAQALWPVHNDVKASAIRMSLSGIQYKTQTTDLATLKARIAAAQEIFGRAETQLRALQPPASLQKFHDEYFGAVRLYQQSSAEMLKVFDDQREDHLVAAFPLSQEAGQTLRRVGGVLWPGEYVPN